MWHRSVALALVVGALLFHSPAFSSEFTIALDVTPANSDTGSPGRPAIASNGTDYLVISCRELGPSPGYFGVILTSDGAIVSTFPLNLGGAPFPGCSGGTPAVAFGGADYLVVVASAGQIYGMRVSPAGFPLDVPGGFPISSGTASSTNFAPSVAFDGSQYLVVWQKFINSGHDIYAARVSPSGAVFPEFSVSNGPGPQVFPAVASDGLNFLVVWEDGESDADLRAARVAPDGVVLDPASINISTAVGRQSGPSIVYGGSRYLVVWEDGRHDSGGFPPALDIFGARIDSAGTLLDGQPATGGIPINTAPHPKSHPRAAFDGTDYRVVWEASVFYEPPVGIYAARVTTDGILRDGPPQMEGPLLSLPSCFACRLVFPDIGFSGDNLLVAWNLNAEVGGEAKDVVGFIQALGPIDADRDGFLEGQDCDDRDASTHPGAVELCDNRDNDCDDTVDQFITTCGLGPCQATGTCEAGIDTCMPGQPSQEICDQIDNDCNGAIDDDVVATCGLGECRREADDCIGGQQTCVPGQPSLEVCDLLDNDCDGDVDNETQDADLDGTGDTCDRCVDVPNPAQTEQAGCIGLSAGGGACLEASIQTIRPDQDGDLRFFVAGRVLADEMIFTLNASSCEIVQGVEFFLNGASLGTFLDSSTSCVCRPEDQQFVVDPDLLRSLWRRDGGNVVAVRKAGAPSPPGQFIGTFIGWIRVVVRGGADQLARCLIDVNGGVCDQSDQCIGGATEDAIDLSETWVDPLAGDELALTVPYAHSTFPGVVDISTIPDGDLRVCISTEDPAGGLLQDCVPFNKQGEASMAINGAACGGPPTADAGDDIQAECSSSSCSARSLTSCGGATVMLDGRASSDPDGGTLTFFWSAPSIVFDDPSSATPSARFPLGATTVTLMVFDGADSSEDQVVVVVGDSTAPEIHAELDPLDRGGRGDEQPDEGTRFFDVRFSSTDSCDRVPRLSGELRAAGCASRAVANGQRIAYQQHDGKCEMRSRNGVLRIKAGSLVLHVTSTDAAGNTASVDVGPPASKRVRRVSGALD